MWSAKSAVGAATSRSRTGESVSSRYLIIIIACPRSSTRLRVEEAGELGQRLRLVVRADRDVLMRGGELVRDLVVERLDEAFGGHRLLGEECY